MATITTTTGKTVLVHPDKKQWRVGGGCGGRGKIHVNTPAATTPAIILSLSSSVEAGDRFIFRDKGGHMANITQVRKLFRRFQHPHIQDKVKAHEVRADLDRIIYS